ncbi:hypothetical protein BDP27DRAFT_1416667 [Rhodocollybia butyracea]|uniref:CCR4-NOT transcription complex subunit 11 n=1 Tax=Rhodocollybia butyracea TaxID=206335 RepID=A0A9P5Q2Q7_9AGAR|nr:hypothetical protein BDP27DRAFT_1416667 [Rhodocollybia butyracea]
MPTVLTASYGVTLPSMTPLSFSSPSSYPVMPLSSSINSSSPSSPLDSLLTSVRHLLSRALSLPCSTAAQTFTQLVQPTLRFQLALDALLPLLEGELETSSSLDASISSNGQGNDQVAQRILVAFILFSLYAPHPISINPFRSALFVTFINEREKAVRITATSAMTSPASASNEQLVWVLWKILRGDGNDIGPYTPTTLARSPLPPKLAAVNLVLDQSDDNDLDFISARKAGSGATFDTNINTDGNSVSSSTARIFTASEDPESAAITKGMTLVFAARERVLSLPERRALEPILATIAASDIITALDLASIVMLNPSVAYPLFVELLAAFASSSSNFLDILDVLLHLPPSLSTFDFLGKLLRDMRLISIPSAISHLLHPKYDQLDDDNQRIPLGKLIQYQVLGRFIHECIERLDREERERISLEGSGGSSDGDDTWGRGARNLCRFYLSLIKLDIIPNSNASFTSTSASLPSARLSPSWKNNYDSYEPETFSADSVEIAHFALRNSKFEEARVLYGVLATGRLDA